MKNLQYYLHTEQQHLWSDFGIDTMVYTARGPCSFTTLAPRGLLWSEYFVLAYTPNHLRDALKCFQTIESTIYQLQITTLALA